MNVYLDMALKMNKEDVLLLWEKCLFFRLKNLEKYVSIIQCGNKYARLNFNVSRKKLSILFIAWIFTRIKKKWVDK